MVNGAWPSIFPSVIRQHLFISLHRVMVESLTSKNVAHLALMQAAEKNIEERLGDFQGNYRQQRQNIITEELLDIISSFETLNKKSFEIKTRI
ncbi:ATP synthase F1, gamma subunit (plasmid) [[Synechococcus] sp. NIES-970]|nr:ATP synthase F1, gamma subunit [[Synechococcus] sp. NIES-970]